MSFHNEAGKSSLLPSSNDSANSICPGTLALFADFVGFEGRISAWMRISRSSSSNESGLRISTEVIT